MSGYTPTGPFTNGSAPGISAAFLNNIENWIQQLEGDSGATTHNGNTAGSGTFYPVIQGTLKMVFVWLAGYKSTVDFDYTLPVAFTKGCWLASGGIGTSAGGDGGIRLVSSGTSLGIGTITTLNALGGSDTVNTGFWSFGIGQCLGAFDTIRLINTSNAHDGPLIVIGV